MLRLTEGLSCLQSLTCSDRGLIIKLEGWWHRGVCRLCKGNCLCRCPRVVHRSSGTGLAATFEIFEKMYFGWRPPWLEASGPCPFSNYTTALRLQLLKSTEKLSQYGRVASLFDEVEQITRWKLPAVEMSLVTLQMTTNITRSLQSKGFIVTLASFA